MSNTELIKKATNPHMYDSLNWEEDTNSPWRKFLIRILDAETTDLGKVLEIGCGTGSMFSFYNSKGSTSVLGIEPSLRLYTRAINEFPDFHVQNSTFESAEIKEKYSSIFSLFVLEHIFNLEMFFGKVQNLLEPKGKFYLVMTDKKAQETPRNDYQIETHKLDENISIHKTLRSEGLMYDIIRDARVVKESAIKAGLVLNEHKEIYPDIELLAESDKFSQFKNRTICHLFIFTTGT